MAGLTLDEFVAALEPCENLAHAEGSDFAPEDYQPGFLFRGSYWIADSYTDDGALADGKGGTLPRYWTILERDEIWDDDLKVVAEPLWKFVMGEEAHRIRAHRLKLQQRLVQMIAAGRNLLTAWEEAEAEGDEVPADGYPFSESLEEVLANVSAYREKIDRWAVEEREADGGNEGTQETRHEAGDASRAETLA